eukprot:6476476-Karenia_brevis.AAC.1
MLSVAMDEALKHFQVDITEICRRAPLRAVPKQFPGCCDAVVKRRTLRALNDAAVALPLRI